MKKIQKLIGLVLIVMLISIQLVPILNVKAEGTTITTYGENPDGIRSDLVTNTANLNVTGVSNGDALAAYKILDAFYNESTNEVTYEFTHDFQGFLDQSTNETYKNLTIDEYFNLTSDEGPSNSPDSITSVITASTLNALVSNYTTYIRKNSTITGIDMVTDPTKDYSTATATVVAGSYLILPKTNLTIEKNSDYDILELKRNMYGVMVGNVFFTADDTGWVLNDWYVYSKSEELNNRLLLASFGISEFINGELTEEDLEDPFSQEISSFFGKKHMLAADIRIPKFPTNAINKVFKLEIEFPTGITYDDKNFFLMGAEGMINISSGKMVNAEGVEYGTVTFNGQKVTININTELIEEDFNFSPSVDVELNDNATVGDIGNQIITRVTVTDDPYVEGSTTTLENSVLMTTYGLELTSYGEKDGQGTDPQLVGAKYEIYADADLTKQIGEFTVGDNGAASFAGVPSGTIYLKQTKAPTGYQLIKDIIPVEIATANATLGSQEGYYKIATYNNAMWYLPTTGGIGTIIYTIIGLGIIIISAIAIIKYKKSVSA